MDFAIDNRPDGITIVHLEGRLDLATAASVKQRITSTIAGGNHRLIIDLDDVPFIDSSGLGVLIGSLKAARLAGGDILIARPTEQARTILQLTTLERILKPYTSVEEAIEHVEQLAAH